MHQSHSWTKRLENLSACSVSSPCFERLWYCLWELPSASLVINSRWFMFLIFVILFLLFTTVVPSGHCNDSLELYSEAQPGWKNEWASDLVLGHRNLQNAGICFFFIFWKKRNKTLPPLSPGLSVLTRYVVGNQKTLGVPGRLGLYCQPPANCRFGVTKCARSCNFSVSLSLCFFSSPLRRTSKKTTMSVNTTGNHSRPNALEYTQPGGKNVIKASASYKRNRKHVTVVVIIRTIYIPSTGLTKIGEAAEPPAFRYKRCP